MMPDKRTQLGLIEKYPEFMLKVVQFGAEHLLAELRRSGMIRSNGSGKLPNRVGFNPRLAHVLLHHLKRNVELELDLSKPDA
jgi:hypothetical protein